MSGLENKIDIIVPYWGDFNLLQQTVESVLNQTSDRWQLYIVDDCYPSPAAKDYICELQHPRVTYLRHEENIGITRNFNYAIELAQSEYCAIVGCDDLLLPNFVSHSLSVINSADMYQGGVDVIDADNNSYLPLGDRVKRFLRPQKPGFYSGQKLATSLSHGNWLYFPSIVWRTKTLKQFAFDNNFKIAQDVLLEMDLITNGAVLYCDNTTVFQYRRFDESLSSAAKSDGVRAAEENAVYDACAEKFKAIGWNKAAFSAKLRITARINQLLSR